MSVFVKMYENEDNEVNDIKCGYLTTTCKKYCIMNSRMLIVQKKKLYKTEQFSS